ncbi:MAG: two-component sensor histidine kinase, partial [Planctomycetota bacterium]|nr:two-component sensor histidine kinase [Planctomycetota bacterium]
SCGIGSDRGGRDEADGTPGVGLGLALARGLARDLHGDLALATGGGRGARFELALPRGSSAD